MTEVDLWRRLAALPGFKGRAQRVEVRMPDGFPDVLMNLGDGRAAFIELKVARVIEPCVVRRMTLEQACWLNAWVTGGGIAGVLIASRDQLAYVDREFRSLRTTGTVPRWTGKWDEIHGLVTILQMGS